MNPARGRILYMGETPTEETVKVDFSQVMKTLDGQPMIETYNGRDREVTLRIVCVNALMGVYADEKDLPGEEKVKRFSIAQRIHGGNNEVTAEEIAKIKLLIGKGFAPAVVGPAFKMLEGE